MYGLYQGGQPFLKVGQNVDIVELLPQSPPVNKIGYISRYNTKEELLTGIMIWDLSAAYDTVDTNLLSKKLEIYGCDVRMFF